MQKIGVVAGSFDPITVGHLWLIREAVSLMDTLYVAIGVNASKKCFFSPDERREQVRTALSASLNAEQFDKVRVVFLENELLINFAGEVGAQYLFRGIRNPTDFTYEHQMQMVNRKINPQVHTLFMMPPSHLIEVSSSAVKGLVGFKGWETIVGRYVPPCVLQALSAKVLDSAIT